PRRQVRVRPPADGHLHPAVPESGRQPRSESGLPAGLWDPGGSGALGVEQWGGEARRGCGVETAVAGARALGDDVAGIRRMPAAARELRRHGFGAEGRVWQLTAARALRVE